MAKFGIALGSGPRGLGFESRYSDHRKALEMYVSGAFSYVAENSVIFRNETVIVLGFDASAFSCE